ncbi:MAG TPA: hypothetical protein VHV51_05030 [Polyangiaceae bacterium]|jgi:hypothetical protein|nr:hypothetical protein [Polyangiaceae bacterium]
MLSEVVRLGVLGASVCLLAACGSASSNLFDPPSAQTSLSGPANGGSAGSVVTSGGANSAGGTDASAGGGTDVNAAGTSSVAGTTQTSAAGSSGMMMMGSGHGTCGPAKDVSGGSSGELGTMGPACLRVMGMISGWGCSNFDGRSVKVNGQDVICGQVPLPAAIDGAYYFDISSGTFEYASFYWF